MWNFSQPPKGGKLGQLMQQTADEHPEYRVVRDLSSNNYAVHSVIVMDTGGRVRVCELPGKGLADIHHRVCRLLGGSNAELHSYSTKRLSAELLMWYDHRGTGSGHRVNAVASDVAGFDINGGVVVVAANQHSDELSDVNSGIWADFLNQGSSPPAEPQQSPILPRPEPPGPQKGTDTSRSNTSIAPRLGNSSSNTRGNGSFVSAAKPGAGLTLSNVVNDPEIMQRLMDSIVKEDETTKDKSARTTTTTTRKTKRRAKGWVYLADDAEDHRRRRLQLFEVDTDAGTQYNDTRDRRRSKRLAKNK